jgi:hypothetical protein
MKPAVPKPQRCAIYTRKSSEHNLDLQFNSLDELPRGDSLAPMSITPPT